MCFTAACRSSDHVIWRSDCHRRLRSPGTWWRWVTRVTRVMGHSTQWVLVWSLGWLSMGVGLVTRLALGGCWFGHSVSSRWVLLRSLGWLSLGVECGTLHASPGRTHVMERYNRAPETALCPAMARQSITSRAKLVRRRWSPFPRWSGADPGGRSRYGGCSSFDIEFDVIIPASCVCKVVRESRPGDYFRSRFLNKMSYDYNSTPAVLGDSRSFNIYPLYHCLRGLSTLAA